MTSKILVTGDVDGNMATLFKKIDSVNKKAGPFEMVLCVGSFFGVGNLGWQDYKSGRLKVPIPVYILGPNSKDEVGCYPDLNGSEICENVIYLGKQGSFTTNEGLRIAYMSGVNSEDPLAAKEYNYSIQNLQSLESSLRWDDSRYQGVDILLTSDWSRGIGNRTQPHAQVKDSEVGSPLVSRLALLCRPRYHFCGLHGENYERTPYRNHQSGAEQARHTTRFVALARVGNKEKKKWMYAFNITPMKNLERGELVSQPPGVTDIPFTQQDIEIQGEKKQQFFYDMNAKMEEEDGKKKKRKNENNDGGGGKKAPSGPCWFCLSSAEVEKHLIISVGEHSYLAMAKGALTADHVMILPIGHHQCSVNLPEEVSEEIDRFKSALRKMLKKHGKVPVYFERNYKTQHLQIQVVPVIKEDANLVTKQFLDEASSRDIDLNEIPSHVPVGQLAVQGQPYFLVDTPNKETLFGRVNPGFPIQFGRDVLCGPDLLDMPDRVDWRNCQLSKEEETDQVKEFRKKFSPFDFTME
eukprot:TRINITY_DN9155_c0_g1_i3.p1 TRINITY_DN9155_c0_g1~~TRINITY_DN9155_c0_g1_i3.p1  ORF type:complete len:523 (+),score=146.82 TRINITY_DN9155_c0_g1_i3:40-1608(+)